MFPMLLYECVFKEYEVFCEKFEFRTTFHYVYPMNIMYGLLQDLQEVKYAILQSDIDPDFEGVVS